MIWEPDVQDLSHFIEMSESTSNGPRKSHPTILQSSANQYWVEPPASCFK